MVDPAKLVASAGRLYGGEEGLRELWGEMIPVPEANLRVLSGGEKDIEGAFRVEYTPGHASHHVCYFHEPSGYAFVGDMGGARIPPHEFTVAPTPPPDVDVAAWERSVATIRGWEPAALGDHALRRGAARSSSTLSGGAVCAARARGRARRGGLRGGDGRSAIRAAVRRRCGVDARGRAARPAPHGAGALAQKFG